MTLTLKARLRNRIRHLPVATHLSHECSIWVRTNGRLACKVCGKP